jgi:hypothetical protein
VDAVGRVFVAENDRIRMVDTRLAPTADAYVTTVAGGGNGTTVDGPNATARIEAIMKIALGPDGVLYFIAANTIRRVNLNLPKTDPAYISSVAVVLPAGAYGQVADYVDGPADTAQFRTPHDLGVDAMGRIYVADAYAVRLVDVTRPRTDPSFVTTLVGGFDELGQATAPFTEAFSISVASAGSLVIGAPYRVWKVTPW